MSEYPGVQPDRTKFGEREIEVVVDGTRQEMDISYCVVRVTPPIGDVEEDITVGFGRTVVEARADAWAEAQAHIKLHSGIDDDEEGGG